ncbi:MAG: prepilin-type N-terminal cleavage/methylation domain-containing protein [Prosthecobacter sp.]|jgi:Tfp pilus assembly protein PilE|uniref:prepilin-type N-terminal cleavage/methylation domain-containing protein n=1 Tax=Prosthecobacter sp. TaxID=1965333 RepID=UPI001A0B2B69|nr:prepilin-type N-terminal cleavage/methylation domain-containing protein [Prosthecobacter sp.]MBE2286735.1 prepilin-type N-terminal cleavage/methylation domain-containing protein [Prosthecobacter sp.]
MKVSNTLATRLARRINNKGLTLIELLVVLLILIALAGILIPQLPNMLTRAHTAAASTNIPEANKRIQEFEQIYFKQPAGFDNLTNGTTLVTYLPGDETTYLNPAALSTVAGSADALTAAGITTVAPLAASPAEPTFNPYSGVNVAVADATVVAFVPEATAETLLRPDSLINDNDAYVAFGIGQRSELIGRTTNEAPYHFGDGAGSGPDTNYARYLAVYKVANDGTALNKAIFIGVLAAHDDGLANASGHVSEFFETNSEL